MPKCLGIPGESVELAPQPRRRRPPSRLVVASTTHAGAVVNEGRKRPPPLPLGESDARVAYILPGPIIYRNHDGALFHELIAVHERERAEHLMASSEAPDVDGGVYGALGCLFPCWLESLRRLGREWLQPVDVHLRVIVDSKLCLRHVFFEGRVRPDQLPNAWIVAPLLQRRDVWACHAGMCQSLCRRDAKVGHHFDRAQSESQLCQQLRW
mmetsp:Transcript_55046/g.160651  ORF Transcript_55046/g.160651 Transcript_55046/m.160651 type:complete len:211 (-) Transcript_55046:285-917(-)